MTIIPMRDLKDTVAVEKRCQETQGPVFVTKNGYGKLVVMDIDYYEKTIGKMYEAMLVNGGLQDVTDNKLSDAAQVQQKIKDKYEL